MKNTGKKFFAFALAMVMVFSSSVFTLTAEAGVSTVSYMDGQFVVGENDLPSGDYKLSEDVTILGEGEFVIDKSTTIDLNGHRLIVDGVSLALDENATRTRITIKDTVGGGEIYLKNGATIVSYAYATFSNIAIRSEGTATPIVVEERELSLAQCTITASSAHAIETKDALFMWENNITGVSAEDVLLHKDGCIEACEDPVVGRKCSILVPEELRTGGEIYVFLLLSSIEGDWEDYYELNRPEKYSSYVSNDCYILNYLETFEWSGAYDINSDEVPGVTRDENTNFDNLSKGEYRLTQDTSFVNSGTEGKSKCLYCKSNAAIDLNGHDLTIDPTVLFNPTGSNGKLRIYDSVGTGTVHFDYLLVNCDAVLSLDGGTFYCDNTGNRVTNAIYNGMGKLSINGANLRLIDCNIFTNSGSVSMTSGSIQAHCTNKNSSSFYAMMEDCCVGNSSTITGGSIIATTEGKRCEALQHVYGDLTITGGYFSATTYLPEEEQGPYSVGATYALYYYDSRNDGMTTITGGTFESNGKCAIYSANDITVGGTPTFKNDTEAISLSKDKKIIWLDDANPTYLSYTATEPETSQETETPVANQETETPATTQSEVTSPTPVQPQVIVTPQETTASAQSEVSPAVDESEDTDIDEEDDELDDEPEVAPLEGVKITGLENLSKGIMLKWTKNSDATGYYVYRNDKLVAQLRNNDVTSYKDTSKLTEGKKYGYEVIAYRVIGEDEIYSDDIAEKSIYYVKQAKITSAKNTKGKKITLSWKKNSKANGYEVKYTLGKTSKTIKVKDEKKIKTVISSLKKGKKYTVSVRSYKTVKGIKYYGAWSSSKKVKINK